MSFFFLDKPYSGSIELGISWNILEIDSLTLDFSWETVEIVATPATFDFSWNISEYSQTAINYSWDLLRMSSEMFQYSWYIYTRFSSTPSFSFSSMKKKKRFSTIGDRPMFDEVKKSRMR